MKTTIDISDDLAKAAKAYAARHNVTLGSLVGRGLREVMRVDRQRADFKLKNVRVASQGLQTQYRDAGWSCIREAVYKGWGN